MVMLYDTHMMPQKFHFKCSKSWLSKKKKVFGWITMRALLVNSMGIQKKILKFQHPNWIYILSQCITV